MTLGSGLKSVGYVVSSVSVVLLGIVSWRTAQEDLVLATCLVGGMLASLLGMALRWASYQLEERS